MKYIFIVIAISIVLFGAIYWSVPPIAFAQDAGYDSTDEDEVAYDTGDGYIYQEGDTITQEIIDQEEEWLERKLIEINETPVEEYGSLILKQKERAYYAKRLELLHENPENYFKTKEK